LRPTCVLLALALALVIAGCGERPIDARKAEAQIRSLVTQRVGVRVAAVTCPTGIIAKKGRTFRCRIVAADRSEGDVVVTSRDGRGAIAIAAPFLPVSRSEADMSRLIDEQFGESVKVSCPEVIVIRKGATFRCTSRSVEGSSSVEGRFLDDRGRYSFHPD